MTEPHATGPGGLNVRGGGHATQSGHWTWLRSRILPWAEREANVRALAVLGSQVRTDRPADAWSDMDLLLLVTDPDAIRERDEWLHAIGPVWLALRHPGPLRDLPVRQVMFEGALDFDIVAAPAGRFAEVLANPDARQAIGEGFYPVLDKDGEMAATPIPPLPATNGTPDAATFSFVVNDFLFQTVFVAKRLHRGELWRVKADVDCYMKGDLLRMIEWHARACRPGVEVWPEGRYMERWADPKVLDALPATFALYERSSVARALLAMTDLFGDVGQETANALGLTYPAASHRAVAAWVRATVAEFR
ncbi:MAG: aminoglycoside 6-adenylyltransferase [Armatimonadota bacterium]|nr:aminoglycoside 6-adenylyltransferase [Armatimonadota bacterium]